MSLVKFMPRWFISRCFLLVEAIVNGIVFLVFLYNSWLLLNKNATDFWIFILYPANLMNLFISSSSLCVSVCVCVKSTGFFTYSIMSSANNDGFTSSFPIWKLISSSCLIAVARTSSTMLSKSGESGHPFLS